MLKENTLITNFQPHFHLRGKAMQVEAILPDGSTQIVSYVGNFNFNWMTNYIYADDAAPVFPKGTVIHVTRVVRQHEGEQEQPRSGSVGRLRRSHRRRDGARLDERRLSERRRIRGSGSAEHKTEAADDSQNQQQYRRLRRTREAGPPLGFAMGVARSRSRDAHLSTRGSSLQ